MHIPLGVPLAAWGGGWREGVTGVGNDQPASLGCALGLAQVSDAPDQGRLNLGCLLCPWARKSGRNIFNVLEQMGQSGEEAKPDWGAIPPWPGDEGVLGSLTSHLAEALFSMTTNPSPPWIIGL